MAGVCGGCGAAARLVGVEAAGGGGGGGLVMWRIMSAVERTKEACMAVMRPSLRWAVRDPGAPI